MFARRTLPILANSSQNGCQGGFRVPIRHRSYDLPQPGALEAASLDCAQRGPHTATRAIGKVAVLKQRWNLGTFSQ